MRKLIIISSILVGILASCIAMGFSPGTLGETAIRKLNCSKYDLSVEINKLIKNEDFKTSIEDTSIISWWQSNGYDFLNYKCLNINKTLYMITIDSENSATTDISIRSFYDRRKKEWMVAKNFSSKEDYNAEKAMDYLLQNISHCKVNKSIFDWW